MDVYIETDSFTNLGSTINKNGGTEEYVKARIQKPIVAFIMLRKSWRAKKIKINTKLKWTDKVPNTTLWKRTKQIPIEN